MELKNLGRSKGSFVAMRKLMKRVFFYEMQKQCENKSLVLNVIQYGCGSTVCSAASSSLGLRIQYRHQRRSMVICSPTRVNFCVKILVECHQKCYQSCLTKSNFLGYKFDKYVNFFTVSVLHRRMYSCV